MLSLSKALLRRSSDRVHMLPYTLYPVSFFVTTPFKRTDPTPTASRRPDLQLFRSRDRESSLEGVASGPGPLMAKCGEAQMWRYTKPQKSVPLDKQRQAGRQAGRTVYTCRWPDKKNERLRGNINTFLSTLSIYSCIDKWVLFVNLSQYRIAFIILANPHIYVHACHLPVI